MGRSDGSSAAWGLALIGILLLVWPRDSALFAALCASISYASWSAAGWLQTKLVRWVRVLIAACITAVVVLIHVLVPRGGDLLTTIALTGGSLAVLLPAYFSAAWEMLPNRLTGRDLQK